MARSRTDAEPPGETWAIVRDCDHGVEETITLRDIIFARELASLREKLTRG